MNVALLQTVRTKPVSILRGSTEYPRAAHSYRTRHTFAQRSQRRCGRRVSSRPAARTTVHLVFANPPLRLEFSRNSVCESALVQLFKIRPRSWADRSDQGERSFEELMRTSSGDLESAARSRGRSRGERRSSSRPRDAHRQISQSRRLPPRSAQGPVLLRAVDQPSWFRSASAGLQRLARPKSRPCSFSRMLMRRLCCRLQRRDDQLAFVRRRNAARCANAQPASSLHPSIP